MKPRIKMHQMPGDHPKRIKIAMLEIDNDSSLPDGISRKCCKSFKKLIKLRERAVLNRQADKEINQEI